MPELMTPDRWERIKSLFGMALEIEPAKRSSFIAEVAGDDEELRLALERLLESDESATGFLEKPVLNGRIAGSSGAGGSGAAAFESGDVLAGRFRIVQLIGRGGMGEVYEVEDRALPKTRIALKTIRADVAGRSEHGARFREEVRLARSITHVGVCRVYELFETTVPGPGGAAQPVMFLTMELLHGKSLAQRIEKDGPMDPQRALSIFRQIGSALEAAQALGIVHCDLKSSNIILTGDPGEERAVITDFGLARFAREAMARQAPAGTPDYMAPEQFEGAPAAFTTDIYSLGVMACEALTGKRPFSRQRMGARPDRTGELELALRSLRDVDREWTAVVRRCLQDDPALRYPSAHELSAGLELMSSRETRMRRRAFIGLCAAGIAGAGYLALRPRPSAVVAPLKLAVLPFEDLTPGRRLEFLADGLTEELIRTLSHIRNLRVVGRASAFQFKHKTDSIQEIGRRLGCRKVVRGTVRSDGDRMVVHTLMADTATGKTVWQRVDEVAVADAMAIKPGLALAMIGSWDLDVAPQDMDFVKKAATTNPEAYNLYLLGRYQAGLRTIKGWENSLELYAKAISLDPNFALAYAASADAYNVLAGQEGHPIATTLAAAKQNAIRALQLDPASPEAHATFALVCQRLDWDWANADLHFRASINLNPGFATGHQWYGGFLSNLGRLTQALTETRTARELDPLSVPVNSTYGGVLTRMGRWDEAIQQFRFTLTLAPESGAAYSLLGEAYAGKGDWPDAVEAKRRAVQTSGDAGGRAGLAYALARAGKTSEALAILNELEGAGAPHVPLAQVYTGLGQYDEAVRQLEMALEAHEPSIVSIKVEPYNAPLQALPEFQSLLKKLRLND